MKSTITLILTTFLALEVLTPRLQTHGQKKDRAPSLLRQALGGCRNQDYFVALTGINTQNRSMMAHC